MINDIRGHFTAKQNPHLQELAICAGKGSQWQADTEGSWGQTHRCRSAPSSTASWRSLHKPTKLKQREPCAQGHNEEQKREAVQGTQQEQGVAIQNGVFKPMPTDYFGYIWVD